MRSVVAVACASALFVAGAAAEPAGWTTVADTEGGFVLAFPGEPRAVEEIVDLGAAQLRVKLYVLETEGGTLSYVAGWYPLPDDPRVPAKQLLDAARDGAVANTAGELRSETPLVNAGHPGRELVIVSPDGVVTQARVYARASRVVQVMVTMPAHRRGGREAAQFFDSLRLDAP